MKNFNYKTKLIFSITLAVCSFILLNVSIISCEKKKKYEGNVELEQNTNPNKKTFLLSDIEHEWFYFSNDTFCKIEKPEFAPTSTMVPWPDAIRISSANNTGSGDKAFAVVNRLGLLCFEEKKITLTKDISVFSNHTADNLFFSDDVPVFSIYRSSFFEDSPNAAKATENNAYLLQFDEKSEIIYPVLNINNITKEKNTEIIETVWDGIKFYCNLKTVDKEKTSFSFVTFMPMTSITSLSPNNAKNKFRVEEISMDDFKKSKEIKDFNSAPSRIKKLLNGFSDKIPFVVEVKSAGGSSPLYYSNNLQTARHELNSKAVISKSWSACLFQDGTFYIEGILPHKGVLNNNNPVAIRLPKLPDGYIYTDFVIAGTTLYAGWEETSFYKTNKSGFLSINLDLTLYNKHN